MDQECGKQGYFGVIKKLQVGRFLDRKGKDSV